MKNIILAIVLFILAMFLNTLSIVFSIMEYIKNNYSEASISIKKGVIYLNQKPLDIGILDFPASQLFLFSLNIFFFLLLFLLDKRTKVLQNLLKKINFKGIVICISIVLSLGLLEFLLIKLGVQFKEIKKLVVLNNSIFNNILIIVNVVLLIPIIEELIFRYFLLSGILEVTKRKFVAIFFSSILFSVAHVQYNFTILIFVFISSSAMGFVYLKYKNIAYPIIIHSLNNFIALIVLSYF